MGPHHTAVITTEGVLYTFGDGAYGVLGNGNSNFTLSPHMVGYFDEKVRQVDCGKNHTIALTATGKVYTWGRGSTRNILTRPIFPGTFSFLLTGQ